MNRLLCITLCILSTITVSGEEASDTHLKEIIIVDPVKGTVGDVNIRQNIDTTIKEIGEHRVRKEIEYLEGHPNDVYIIDINGYSIRKYHSYVSFTSPIFRLKDTELGVGSTIKEFHDNYGRGKYNIADAESYDWISQNPMYHFCVPAEELEMGLSGEIIVNENQKVSELTVW